MGEDFMLLLCLLVIAASGLLLHWAISWGDHE